MHRMDILSGSSYVTEMTASDASRLEMVATTYPS